jgi:Predicted transcriptional regulators
MNQQIFEQLGLSERDVSIYKALLALGPSAIRTVAERAGVNRGTTYECLKSLQQRGVVTYLPKGKRRYFSARDQKYYSSWHKSDASNLIRRSIS